MKEDEIYGTKNPTPHQVLLDTRFELPFGNPAALTTAKMNFLLHSPYWRNILTETMCRVMLQLLKNVYLLHKASFNLKEFKGNLKEGGDLYVMFLQLHQCLMPYLTVIGWKRQP